MTTTVDKSVEVNVPVGTAYNQWTQFEDFPRFMGGVHEVRQLDDRTLHWVAEISGVKREWDATIVEQVPDEKVAWAATGGTTNSGIVEFEPVGPDRTMVRLHLEYEPEGFVEQAGDKLRVVARQAESDLERFKEFIESRGTETGAWRGSISQEYGIGSPDAEDVATSGGTHTELAGSSDVQSPPGAAPAPPMPERSPGQRPPEAGTGRDDEPDDLSPRSI